MKTHDIRSEAHRSSVTAAFGTSSMVQSYRSRVYSGAVTGMRRSLFSDSMHADPKKLLDGRRFNGNATCSYDLKKTGRTVLYSGHCLVVLNFVCPFIFFLLHYTVITVMLISARIT